MIFTFLAALTFLNAAQADSTLKFNYQVTCDPSDTTSFPGLIAEIKVGKRLIRSYLVRYQNQQVVTLGAPTPEQLSKIDIRYRKHSSCRLSTIQTQVLTDPTPSANADQALALTHSPYLVLRPDQASHPDRDVPLQLGYSISRSSSGTTLKYTLYFSNETDHGMFSTSKSKSQALYGRRTDIEWIYQVDFDRQGAVVDRKYQSGVIFGIGHATKTFRGQFLKGTEHPVLYDIAKHNVFFDHPYPGQSGRTAAAHLTPTDEIKFPYAREDWLWRNPWVFDLSDRELRRTHSLTYPSEEYLYVKISGAMNGGKIAVTGTGMIMKKITLTKLGEDLWGQEAYVAFRVRQMPGSAGFIGDSVTFGLSGGAQVQKLQFFTLTPNAERGFITSDITSRFSCSGASCQY